MSVDYDIKVPFNVIVKSVGTSNGAIELKGTHGDTEISASNGTIAVEDSKGDIDARTSNGTIEIKDVTGYVSARTSNGAIELNIDPALDIDLEAKTSNGKITVKDLEVVVQEISKTSLRGRLGEGGKKVSCRTSNGAIELSSLN